MDKIPNKDFYFDLKSYDSHPFRRASNNGLAETPPTTPGLSNNLRPPLAGPAATGGKLRRLRSTDVKLRRQRGSLVMSDEVLMSNEFLISAED